MSNYVKHLFSILAVTVLAYAGLSNSANAQEFCRVAGSGKVSDENPGRPNDNNYYIEVFNTCSTCTDAHGIIEFWSPTIPGFAAVAPTGQVACADLSGELQKLCNQYCESLRCDTSVAGAPAKTCIDLRQRIKTESGSRPYCGIRVVAENFSQLVCRVDGGRVGDAKGPATVDGQTGFVVKARIFDLDNPDPDFVTLAIYDAAEQLIAIFGETNTELTTKVETTQQ